MYEEIGGSFVNRVMPDTGMILAHDLADINF